MAEQPDQDVVTPEAEAAVEPVEQAVPVVSAQDSAPEEQLAEQDQDPSDFLTWEASEYIHHHKGTMWYVALSVIVAILLVLALVYKLWLSIAVFVAMGAAIAVYAHKPPRVLTYQLDSVGVTIDGKLYSYETFRSFGVLSDIEWHAMDLEPAQRFMPRLTILFGDDDFDDIVAHLERHLPRADRDPDLVERLTRYLRF